MILSRRIKLALGLWFVAELLVFIALAKVIGVAEAVLVGIVTSLVGWTLLKRTGAAAMVKLRALIEGRVEARETPRFLDDGLATLGALALLMPGFLSDLVGFALAVPAARDRLSGWIGAGRVPGFDGTRRSPSTIDLAPEEWERTEGRPPISKPSRP